ncbi:hypothetical protein LTR86_004198 [Recurvomyces mirabilis]|nr:hypothetical protein LTR86_004198 [Recurvomyces mirabilis]
MSAIGPDLPPYLLAKRKRKQEASTKDKPAIASGAKPLSDDSNNQDGGEKRRKVIGPAMPPAPLDERPNTPRTTSKDAVSEDEDDDDDFGPALPSSANATTVTTDPHHEDLTRKNDATISPAAPEKTQRDAWMTMPPTQDDLAARMDPSKPRARGFNTGKGAKGPNNAMGGEDSNSAWNETPEQKRKRLRDEMMGVATSLSSSSGAPAIPAVKQSKRATNLDDAAREHIAKSRGPSLMSRHEQTKGPAAELEDDPSKRSFDREKDMGAGMRIDGTKRKQLLNQAEGFSSKFAGGSYL